MAQVTVKHKYIHQAPRKIRLVSDMVRGLPTDKALVELATLNKAASLAIRKVILAGIAAAKQQGLNANNLFIGQIMVDEGPKLKRINMLGRGRSAPIQKKMSHLLVTITDEPTTIASSKVYKAEMRAATRVKPAKRTKTAEEVVVEEPVQEAVVAEQTEGSK